MPYLIDEDKNRLKKDNTPKKAGEINYRTTLVYLEKLKNWNKKKIILLGRKPKAIKYPALEIAQILDIPEGTVHSRLNTARKKVRNCLESEKNKESGL